MTKEELLKRFAGRACKKLPNDSSLEERKQVAAIKKEMKQLMRDRMEQAAKPHILANISRHHEHYGDTPLEHMVRKNNS